MIKSTARRAAVCESVLYGFYIFYLSIAQAMNRLVVVFVSREEWSTATVIIDSNYKAANLISPVWLKAVIFGAGYTTERQNFLQIVDTAKGNELCLQCHV